MTIPDEAVQAAVDAYGEEAKKEINYFPVMMRAALTAALPFLTGAPSPRAQAFEEAALERSIERWRGMKPSEVMKGSTAQITYALEDARKDILTLYSAISSQPVADGCKVYVAEMKTSSGTDYFVMMKSGDRELSIRKHRWKHHADYEAAEYNWLFNGGDKPDILAFRPVSAILPASPGASE